MLFKTLYNSPVGVLTLMARDAYLVAVLWPEDKAARVPLLDEHGMSSHDHPVLLETIRQLNEYFAKTRMIFNLPIAPEGTAFQKSIWLSLAQIPYGQTRSYAEQALKIGNPKAVRAVGAANGRNPLSIILPCHRVIGQGGALTGFAGGLKTKAYLLEHEGALVAPFAQTTLF